VQTRDRRRKPRSSGDRRRSARWPVGKPVTWRVSRSRRIHRGVLLERSLDGLVMMSPARAAPRPGSRLLPGSEDAGERHGFRTAIVKRTRRTYGHMEVIYAEIET
jgi:hypothetical protein